MRRPEFSPFKVEKEKQKTQKTKNIKIPTEVDDAEFLASPADCQPQGRDLSRGGCFLADEEVVLTSQSLGCAADLGVEGPASSTSGYTYTYMNASTERCHGKTTDAIDPTMDKDSQNDLLSTVDVSKQGRRRRCKERAKHMQAIIEKDDEHKLWISDRVKELQAIGVEYKAGSNDEEASFIGEQMESALSRERRKLLDQFLEGEKLVYSPEFIKDTALAEIQFQMHIICGASSECAKFDFDVLAQVLQALVYVSEYSQLCPVPGADFPGAKLRCMEMASNWRRLFSHLSLRGAFELAEHREDWLTAVKQTLRCAPFTQLLMQALEDGFETLLETEFGVKDNVASGTQTQFIEADFTSGLSA